MLAMAGLDQTRARVRLELVAAALPAAAFRVMVCPCQRAGSQQALTCVHLGVRGSRASLGHRTHRGWLEVVTPGRKSNCAAAT